MKLKVVIVILAVVCVGIAIALIATKKQADDRHAEDLTAINNFSNQVVVANDHLEDLGQVNLTLSNSLASSQLQVALGEEQLTQLSNSLAAAYVALADARNSLFSAEELVTNLNNRIADLETQNKALDDQADSLSNRLAQLNVQIEETKNQLAVSETNAAFLQNELQKQLAQKAELEHKFNDIDELRIQVKKIKDEMFVERRIQLDKYGTGSKKGGEMLMSHNNNMPFSVPAPSKPPTSTYDLNVEIGSDGSVRVIPPMGSTNSPPSSTNNPPQ
jgi:predicted RNase H-like nuclease (RuvC/YqgF family)